MLDLGDEEVRFAPPLLFQIGEGGERLPVEGRYRLAGGTVGFAVGDYDRDRELVIDPVLLHASYLGGGYEHANGVTFDAAGNVYLVTMTNSSDFPTVNAIQPASGGGGDAVVTRLAPTATEILFSTYVGGSGHDTYPVIAALEDGILLFFGIATSTNLPMVNSWDPTGDGADVALFKLAPDGSEILFSTYFGGSSYDIAAANFGSYGAANVSVDDLGRIYFGGFSYSDDLPVTPNAFQPARAPGTCDVVLCPDSFVAVFSPDGQTLVYSTYYGVPGEEIWPLVPTAAPDGDVLLAGTRTAAVGLLPVRNAYQPLPAGGDDLYIARLPIDGSPPRFATYFGGPYNDGATVALDAEGRIGLAGITSCLDFPLLYSENPGCPPPGNVDAFVARLNARGTGLDFSSLYQGSIYEGFGGLGIDAAGNFATGGLSTSTDFPWVDPVFPPAGGTGAMLAYLHTTGPQLLFATPYGGTGTDYGSGTLRPAASIWRRLLSFCRFPRDFWLDAIHSTFAGSPFGCDSNGDAVIDAGDLACTSRLILGLACAAPLAPEGPPARLLLPDRLAGTSGGTIALPIELQTGGQAVRSVVFSLDLPPSLSFDPATGIRDLPPGITATATYLASRTFGELQVAITPGGGNLPAGVLLELELESAALAATAASIVFGVEPKASWGGSRGESLEGETGGRTLAILTPAGALFYDGFESGDASRWSAALP